MADTAQVSKNISYEVAKAVGVESLTDILLDALATLDRCHAVVDNIYGTPSALTEDTGQGSLVRARDIRSRATHLEERLRSLNNDVGMI